MSRPRSIGMTVLGVWLILHGVIGLVPMAIVPGLAFVAAVLALVAGILILMGR